MVVCFEIIENAGSAGRNAYILDVMPEAERVGTQAYMYSALNVGFTVGAIIGGVALAFDNLTVMRWMPLFTLAIGLVNAVFITRLPRAPHDVARSSSEPRKPRGRPVGRGPLHNVGWMLGSLFSGTMWTNQVLLNVAIPLWLVQATDAPHWLLAWLFGTNTVLAVLLQTRVSRHVPTFSAAAQAQRLAGLLLAGCCACLALSAFGGRALATAALAAAILCLTLSELLKASAAWQITFALAPPGRAAEFFATYRLGATACQVLGPIAITAGVLALGSAGWALLGLVFVLAGLATPPLARRARTRPVAPQRDHPGLTPLVAAA
jgi:hypothetical protein